MTLEPVLLGNLRDPGASSLKNLRDPNPSLGGDSMWSWIGTFGHGCVRQKNVMGLSASDKIYEEVVTRQPDDAIQLIEEFQTRGSEVRND